MWYEGIWPIKDFSLCRKAKGELWRAPGPFTHAFILSFLSFFISFSLLLSAFLPLFSSIPYFCLFPSFHLSSYLAFFISAFSLFIFTSMYSQFWSYLLFCKSLKVFSYIKGGTQAKAIRGQDPEANIWVRMGSGEGSTKNFIICTVHIVKTGWLNLEN